MFPQTSNGQKPVDMFLTAILRTGTENDYLFHFLKACRDRLFAYAKLNGYEKRLARCKLKICSGKSESERENAMNVIDAIHCRHSYRGKYKDIPVPKDELIKIMQAGLEAPSGCNMQTTSLIAVDEPKVLEKLHRVIVPPVGETAPAAICVLTQRINAYRDKCFAVQDYSAAIQNMLLAIVELGYQSCWYEGHITDDDRICDQMAQILNVPDNYELVCYLPVGIAENDLQYPKKKPFEERAWFNSFPYV